LELFEGQIISAPFLKDKAEVKKFESRAGYFILELILLRSRVFQTLRISDSQLQMVNVETADTLAVSRKSEDFFFWIQANILRLAYQFDPLLAVNVSQVDPLPHQIEAVYSYVLRDPKVRFLIADDAGAGKTIMAGLAIKELQYRNLAKKILVVAPGHLKYQWQREMKTKFGTNFTLVNRNLMDAHWGENIWENLNHCVTSIDFLKQDDIIDKLSSSFWDFVVIDEAHKMSAYGYSSKKGVKVEKTARYRVGEMLSKRTTHMLFLTATPHRGDEENFRLFLDLLRPGFFSKTDLLKESIRNEENPLFIRRLKEDMRDFKGNHLFTPRHVNTVSFPLTSEENELYNEVTKYVKDYFDRAKENRSITFAMMILQRRLTSSTHAILRSLEKRKERLEGLLELPDKIRADGEYDRVRNLSSEDLEDMAEEERWAVEEKLMNLTLASNIDEVNAEIDKLGELIELAKRVREKEIESKLVKLRDEILSGIGDKKLLIFTEFKDTVDYLIEKLESWGYKVNTIHGSMGMDARIEAEHRFKNETQIMVATEAAGEGINLQFCSVMVNYDIPWNPNRLEQRMGRIHRYGQKKEVFIYNMVSKNTREGQILERLFEKLNSMREDLGSDRVFDVIGELIPGESLESMLRDAITGQRRIEEIYEIVDTIDSKEVEKKMNEIFMTSLATRHIDYTGIMKTIQKADENRLMPEYIEDYFLRCFQRFGGKYEKREETYSIKSVPYEFKKFNKDYEFKSNYGMVQNSYTRLTFDKDVSRDHPEYEYIAPGHPLLESVNQLAIDEHGHDESVAVFTDETNTREGVLWFIQGEVVDGRGMAAGRRVFCLFQDMKGRFEQVNPSVIWDYAPANEVMLSESHRRMFSNRQRIEEYAVIEIMFPYKSEVEEKRRQEAAIKEKYGLRSIDYLLQESNDKLLNYQLKLEAGEDMHIAIRNEEKRKEDFEEKQRDLIEEINLEREITVSEPRILGSALIIPLEQVRPDMIDSTHSSSMVRDDEIEEVGMTEAMRYEQDNGWTPEDVHTENLGFDIRSTKYNEDGTFADIRYIEVKARAKDGSIRISANEWKKAKRFQDKFWLYVVTMAVTNNPKLERFCNPEKTFKIDEDIYATGYIIPKEKIKKNNSYKN
jgi:superfamily II DNA or RNA helicase